MALLAIAPACARKAEPPAPREVELGGHRVQVIVPAAWDLVDQGSVKRFRKGESEIALQNLGTPKSEPRDLDGLVDWGLRALDHNKDRQEEKSRVAHVIDGRDAVYVETWARLDHSNPHRYLLINDGGDLLTLHTPRMALEDTLTAFDSIRQSIHFVSERR